MAIYDVALESENGLNIPLGGVIVLKASAKGDLLPLDFQLYLDNKIYGRSVSSDRQVRFDVNHPGNYHIEVSDKSALGSPGRSAAGSRGRGA